MISAGTATAKTYSDRPSLTLSESSPASAAPQPIRTIPKIGAMMARAFTVPVGMRGGRPAHSTHRNPPAPAPGEWVAGARRVAYFLSSTFIGSTRWLAGGSLVRLVPLSRCAFTSCGEPGPPTARPPASLCVGTVPEASSRHVTIST